MGRSGTNGETFQNSETPQTWSTTTKMLWKQRVSYPADIHRKVARLLLLHILPLWLSYLAGENSQSSFRQSLQSRCYQKKVPPPILSPFRRNRCRNRIPSYRNKLCYESLPSTPQYLLVAPHASSIGEAFRRRAIPITTHDYETTNCDGFAFDTGAASFCLSVADCLWQAGFPSHNGRHYCPRKSSADALSCRACTPDM